MNSQYYIDPELYEFAYFPNWYEQLDALAQLALPESWRFVSPDYETKNQDTPILEKYLREVFRAHVICYNTAEDQWQAKATLYLSGRNACFHTGLLSRNYRSIYACFDVNKRLNSPYQWYFHGFEEESSPALKYVSPLPQRADYYSKTGGVSFIPAWPIRINIKHMLEEPENLARIPEGIRSFSNLSLLMETAAELGRRLALAEPGIVAPQFYRDRIQFLLPLMLTNMEKPDLVMMLNIMDGYYMGETCLTPQMAYCHARILGKPTAKWLLELV